MALVCGIRDFILQLVPGESNVYYYWDKIDKVIRSRAYASVDDFYQLNDGAIVDTIESGGVVYLVTKNNSGSVVDYLPLSSTSGDYYNKLISATVSGTTLTVVMYALIAKETTTLTFALQSFTNDSPADAITPCITNFVETEGTVITSWCDGFTLHQIVVTQSPSGIVETVTANSVTCGYSAPADPFRVSEEKIVKIKRCTYANPVYFVWKNTLGGWDYFLFDRNQTENIQTESEGTYAKYYTRIGDTTNPEGEIGKLARTRTVYYANSLTTDEKDGIITMLYSNKVYIINESGVIQKEVRILEGSFLWKETKNTFHEISFEVFNPPINTIKN